MGADSIEGGDGFDIASYENAHERVVVSLADPSVNVGDATGDSYADIEGVVGGAGNDDLTGCDCDNLIAGGLATMRSTALAAMISSMAATART